MEILAVLLGLISIYAVVHFFMLQHSKNWTQRNMYEKIVTIFAIISISLIFLGIMFGGE